MIVYKNGNILTSRADIICHQVNCQGVMGAGLAKQIRNKHPKVYDHYIWHCKTFKPNLLGNIILDSINEKQVIASLFAQDRYGRDKRYTDYDAFEKCLKTIACFAKENEVIALPYKIGCGLGGGDWDIILSLIEKELSSFTVEIWKY